MKSHVIVLSDARHFPPHGCSREKYTGVRPDRHSFVTGEATDPSVQRASRRRARRPWSRPPPSGTRACSEERLREAHLHTGLMREPDAPKAGWAGSFPAGPPDKDALARIVDADGGRDDAENSYYEEAADPSALAGWVCPAGCRGGGLGFSRVLAPAQRVDAAGGGLP
jgi:hypothetical protein